MVRTTAGASSSPLRPLPPVSSKAKDYTDRPDEVVDELDDLRTRGIAKVLNKHFTTTTRKLAIEKAEADSALADLERRRAQTKAFVPSKGGELNPYDKLYVQLQQKRAECRRKEKETMMLYQRYVMKYGKSAKADPLVSASTSKESQDPGNENGLMNSNGVDRKGDPPGKSALGTLDENSEITFSKFYEKQREEQEKEQQRKKQEEQRKKESEKNFMSALNKFMTVPDNEDDKHQPNGVPELVPSKDSPSPIASSAKVDPFMSAVSKFTTQAKQDDGNFESSILSEQDEDIQSTLQSTPDTGTQNLVEPDLAQSTPATATQNLVEPDLVQSTPAPETKNLVEPDLAQSTPATATKNLVEPDLDNGVSAVVTPEIERPPTKDPPAEASDSVAEDESMVSQQEDLSSKKTDPPNGPAGSAQAKAENVPATPDPVPAAAALTLSPSSHNSTPRSNKVVHVNEETPYFHTTTVEGFEFDDRSIISELTSANSAVTRQLMDEVETEMEDFIKFEMEAIRKMLDSEEDASTVDNSVKSENSSLMLADRSVHVAMKAEAMAAEMQKILDDFAKEDASSVHSASKSQRNESVHSSDHRNESNEPVSVYPYKFEPAIPGEDWYVHFDDNYQKEYYVEKNSNRTQWDYPQKVPTPRMDQAVSSDDFLSDMHSVASSRRSLSRRSSRRALYRKQRKKRRARRLMMSFVALLCVLITVFYWRIHHPDESVAGALVGFVIGLKNLSVKGVVSGVVDRFEYSFTNRKEREELIRLQQETLAKIEEEKKARELADQRAMEETQRILKEAKERALQAEAAKKLIEEQETARQQQVSTNNAGDGRPWGCNIPFAYVVPQCGRLAKTKPVFGLKSETDLLFLQ